MTGAPAGSGHAGSQHVEPGDVVDQDGIAATTLEQIYAPHRMTYLRGENKPADESGEQCPFCRIPGLPDADGLIVARGELVYTVLNLFPYNSGHLMICPYRHVPDYTDLEAAEVAEFGAMTQQAMRALRAISSCQGFNVGMNQGRAGGAGNAAHLHQHVLPRWVGDTNFIYAVGQTRVLPQLLGETRDLLARAWAR